MCMAKSSAASLGRGSDLASPECLGVALDAASGEKSPIAWPLGGRSGVGGPALHMIDLRECHYYC